MVRRTHGTGGRFLRPSRGWGGKGKKEGRVAPASQRLTPWANVCRPSGAKTPKPAEKCRVLRLGGEGEVTAANHSRRRRRALQLHIRSRRGFVPPDATDG